jgi:hypothetical protein
MRTLILFVVALLIIPIDLFSQIENVYGTYYTPDRQYKFKNEIYTTLKKSLEGDKQLIDGINFQSIYPLSLYVSTSNEMLVSTGSVNKDTIPIKFSFLKDLIKTTLNDRTVTEKNPCKGIAVEGNWSNNRFVLKPKILDGLTVAKRNHILGNLELSKTQVLFPAIPLKIGDRFKWKNATDIPIFGSAPVHCIVTSIFTLEDTIKNVARFTINQEIVQDSSRFNPSVELKGFGYGSLDYDTYERFLTNRIINETISMKLNTEAVKIIIDYTWSINQEVKIEKNNSSTDIKLDHFSYYDHSRVTDN